MRPNMKKILLTVTGITAAVLAWAQSPHECICFDKDWRFSFEYTSTDGLLPFSPAFDSSDWGLLDLPHDWTVDTITRSQEGKEQDSILTGWYRKTFTVPAEDEGKHLWLQFDGISSCSSIWVNGFYLGHELSGYATQTYDITDYLDYDGENLVCVRVSSPSWERPSGDGAGICRHVWLNKAAPVHVAPSGTSVHAEFARESARKGGGVRFDLVTMHIGTEVRNMGNVPAGYTLRHTLKDAEGRTAGICTVDGKDEGGYRVEAKESHITDGQIVLKKPQLWSCSSPYLYNIVTEVYCEGKLIDTYTTTTGIRHVEYDPDKGLVLNGRPVDVKGLDMNGRHAGTGSAMPDALQEWRLEQLRKLGCNTLRSEGHPMSPHMLALCDRLGMLVIGENPLSGVTHEHTGLLRRMMRRDRNHPCIIFWDMKGSEGCNARTVRSIQEYGHRFDPTRRMTTGDEKTAFPATDPGSGVMDACFSPQEGAYALQPWWTDEPVLHMTPHWKLQEHEGDSAGIKVFSNCDEVELIADGEKLGRRKIPEGGHLEWCISRKAGQVRAVGYHNGRRLLERRMETSGEAAMTKFAYERTGDIVIVEIEVLDNRMRYVPDACCDMTFTTGEGWRILGWGNPDPSFSQGARPMEPEKDVPDRKAASIRIRSFNGHAQVILQQTGENPYVDIDIRLE